jgi:hypothetical protein
MLSISEESIWLAMGDVDHQPVDFWLKLSSTILSNTEKSISRPGRPVSGRKAGSYGTMSWPGLTAEVSK